MRGGGGVGLCSGEQLYATRRIGFILGDVDLVNYRGYVPNYVLMFLEYMLDNRFNYCPCLFIY